MKRLNFINRGQRLSPSARAIIKLRKRASQSGGASLELQVPTNYIRDISRDLNYDITRGVGATRNLLKYSEKFSNSIWTKSNTTITENTNVSPLNSLLTADKLFETNFTGNFRIIQEIQGNSGSDYTFSFYVKAFTAVTNERRYCISQLISGSDQLSRSAIVVDTSTGVVTSTNNQNVASPPLSMTYSIANINGYYRISVTATANFTGNFFGVIGISDSATPVFGSLGVVTYTGNSVNFITLFGAQLEKNTTATTYQITEETPVFGENLDDGASLIMTPNTIGEGRLFNCKPELSNLQKYSEEFDNVIWTKTQGSITSNAIANPINGNVDADKFIPNTTNTAHVIFSGTSANVVSGNIYTISGYLKSEYPYIIVGFLSARFGSRYVSFDSITGVISNNTTAFPVSIINNGSGWWRVSITATCTSSGVSGCYFETSTLITAGGSFAGDGASGVYIWGAQLEQGSTATAYQRTTDGIIDFQATRATTATVIQKDGSIGESCYNLLSFSEDYSNAVWTSVGITLTSNVTTAPNGTTTASRIKLDATTFDHNRRQLLTSKPAGVYSASGYFKKEICQYGYLVISDTSTSIRTIFDFNSGLITYTDSPSGTFSSVSSSIQSLADGWLRVFITVNKTVAFTPRLDMGITLNPTSIVSIGDNTSSIFIWGSQLAQGQPKDYLKTTNRLAVPSIDYALGSDNPAVLVEPQRTNIIFPSATATTQTRTVTAQPYTLSFYGTGTVDLSGTHTATVVGLGATTLKTYTFTPTAGSLTFTITGTVTNWQCEAGSNYTSRIITTSAAATRNNYTSFVDLFNNNLLNKDNFTLYFEGRLRGNVNTNIMVALSDTTGTSTRANDVGIFDSAKPTYAAASFVDSDTTGISNDTDFKCCIVRSGTSVKWFRNGVQVWTTQTIAVTDYRYLVVNTGGSTYSINKIALWKTTKSDSDCITLTT